MKFFGKCLYIDELKTLVVGDMHLGWEENMNKTGVLVSRGMFDEIIEDFDLIFGKIGKIKKVVLLGDVKHNFGGNLNQEWSDLRKLFDYLSKKCEEIVICKGNHDNYLVSVCKEYKNVKLVDYLLLDGFAFMHGDRDFPEIYSKEIKNWCLGHLHPAVSLEEGVKKEKYKCFLDGKYKDKRVIILPSFFPVIEGSDVNLGRLVDIAWKFDIEKFEVKVVGENLEVLDFGKLKDL